MQYNYSIEEIIFWFSALLIISILGSKAASKFGIPAVLFFLVVGMLTGSDGPGGVPFDDPWVAQFLGVIALAYIVFAGALNTSKDHIKPVLWSGVMLSTLGVFITAIVVAVLVYIFFKVSFLYGLLLGAIVSSTDAAAVFSILRARNINISRNLRSLLELESGSNDPAAVILTLSLIHLIANPSHFISKLIIDLIHQLLIGLLFGYGIGRLTILAVNKTKLEHEGLYPVLTFALVLFIYGVTSFAGGSGFLAVYVAGLIVGNSEMLRKNILVNFHDGIAWLMQIIIFLIFGLLVFPSKLVSIIPEGLLIALCLMFVARPLGVYLSMLFSKINYREKTMVAWVGLRGATPLILATFPVIDNLPQADVMFNVVFFVVGVSILIQAPLIPVAAKWLKVAVKSDK